MLSSHQQVVQHPIMHTDIQQTHTRASEADQGLVVNSQVHFSTSALHIGSAGQA